ncbi:MAG: YqeG family HAD IIIA-type phosphatase [Candidatus Eremiobacterota bacterium]
MLRLLAPDRQVESVTEIDLPGLRSLGIRALLVDLDNTLLAWNHQEMTSEVRQWVARARDLGFQLCLVSNAARKRLTVQAEQLGIPCVPSAQKPRRRALRRALYILGVTPRQAAMVGDQVFTDVLAGNRLGLYTILVIPMHLKEQWWMHLVRRVESWVIWWFQATSQRWR